CLCWVVIYVQIYGLDYIYYSLVPMIVAKDKVKRVVVLNHLYFLNETEATWSYTFLFVGSVRCEEATGICRFIATDVLPRETKKYIATHGNLRAPFLT
ncbi:hypothetical protein, partial [Escherichia coli]|uniref:hypothetical protein n=1 Tax=Escherichia coli TaxID=562 RepID=UPI00259CCF86